MRKGPRRNISQRSELANDLHELGYNPDTREIVLGSYAFTGEEEPGVDYRMATRFIANLRLLDATSSSPVLVHQVTCGGEWSYGMAIYDAITACRSYVCLLAYGEASSMSSIMPQAADYRIITPNCTFMIHHGTGGVANDQVGKITEAAWEARLMGRMLDIYVSRCRVLPSWFARKRWSRERIKTYLDRQIRDKHEVYLSAEGAVDWGLMDEVLDGTIQSVLDWLHTK